MSIFLLTLIAAVVSQILSTVWYMPIFGKAWGAAIGRPMPADGEKMTMKQMAVPMLIMFIGNLLMAFVFFLILAGFGAGSYGQAFVTAAVLYVGFAIPFVASGVMWKGFTNKQQLKQFAIQAGFQLVNFAVWALIFVWLV